ncbi:MAG: hypothetical protein AAF335_04700 [Bacteroidota bacterium]
MTASLEEKESKDSFKCCFGSIFDFFSQSRKKMHVKDTSVSPEPFSTLPKLSRKRVTASPSSLSESEGDYTFYDGDKVNLTFGDSLEEYRQVVFESKEKVAYRFYKLAELCYLSRFEDIVTHKMLMSLVVAHKSRLYVDLPKELQHIILLFLGCNDTLSQQVLAKREIRKRLHRLVVSYGMTPLCIIDDLSEATFDRPCYHGRERVIRVGSIFSSLAKSLSLSDYKGQLAPLVLFSVEKNELALDWVVSNYLQKETWDDVEGMQAICSAMDFPYAIVASLSS